LFNIASEPAAPIRVDTTALRQSLRITIEQQTDLDATVRWFPNPPRGGAAGQEPPIPPQVSLFGERGFGLRAAIVPKNGRLAPGTYKVRATLSDASTVVSTMAGLPLKILAPPGVTLTVVDPQTPAERASAHRQFGHAAARRGQLDDAEREFQLAIQVGGGKSGWYDLGNIYIQRRKYRQAIDCFERLLPDLSRGVSVVPTLLAEAYIGVGDEANAARVLRDRFGMSDQTVTIELERLRQNVNRRNSR
jgi:lipopolysaccharide biosynthesis regulator YciM